MKKCSVIWCKRPHYAKGFCHTHWTAVRRYGNPYGKHAEEYSYILNVFMEAQHLSRMVLTQEPVSGEQCPFCKLIHPQHSVTCVMLTAHRILDKTQWHG